MCVRLDVLSEQYWSCQHPFHLPHSVASPCHFWENWARHETKEAPKLRPVQNGAHTELYFILSKWAQPLHAMSARLSTHLNHRHALRTRIYLFLHVQIEYAFDLRLVIYYQRIFIGDCVHRITHQTSALGIGDKAIHLSNNRTDTIQ